MAKVQVLGPKSLLDDAVRALHAAAIVHIETASALADSDGVFYKKFPLESEKEREKSELARALERLRNLGSLLTSSNGAPRAAALAAPADAPLSTLISETLTIEPEIKRLHAQRDALLDEIALINRYEKVLRGFAGLVPKLGGLKNFEVMGLIVETRKADVIKLIEAETARITNGSYSLYVKELDDETTALVLAYPKAFDASVRGLITGEAISEMRLPDEYGDMPLLGVLGHMTARKAELPSLIKEAELALAKISDAWRGRVEALMKALEDALDEIGVLAGCGQSKFAFVIEGWVPAELFDSLALKFKTLFSGRVLVRSIEVREEETELVPVYIENPRMIRPFELFLKALPTPRYGSVDPTPYIALFFPIFFGLIVGDAAHGLILLAGGIAMRRVVRERPFWRDVGYVVIVSALSTILFGVLFGEFFGDLGERLGVLHPILFDRLRALKTFIALTLGIGAGHVLLGIIIGMANRIAHGKKKEAAAKFAFLMLTASGLFSAAVFLKLLPEELMTPGVVLLALSLVFVILLEGALGPLEFAKTIGNVVSYMRIMAVGTASVVMAMVANKIGGITGSLALGILVAALIHTLNIALSLLSPTIQAMRLQYVEFLSKFYEGGGRVYRPFKKR
jgi:V/A-type H+-transporting ATPase subunit I